MKLFGLSLAIGGVAILNAVDLRVRTPSPLRDAYMDVGSRAPTVGALGDAGAVAEKVGMRGIK
jgi:hypothetical protein